MRLPDINVLLYAHREAAPGHAEFRAWLDDAIADPEPLAVASVVLSGFVRIATHPRIFDPPATLDQALEFADALRGGPNVVTVEPGPRHWDLFRGLCRDGTARGNLISDAYLAALAIENGCELVTTDRDFARFPRLRWRHPLA